MMVEDRSFNEFLKAKLEEGIAVPEVRPQPVRAFSWRRPLLVAASVALVFGISSRFIGTPASDRSCERDVLRVIELLNASEGQLADYSGEASLSEVLLAWQDAPYYVLESL